MFYDGSFQSADKLILLDDPFSVNVRPKGKQLFTVSVVSLLWTFLFCFAKQFMRNCPPNMTAERYLLFTLCNELKKQFAKINLYAVDLSGPYWKIKTAKGTNQNCPIADQFSSIIKEFTQWGLRSMTRSTPSKK